MSYTKVNDPAHGWIGVPESELIGLGIQNKITPYSYRDQSVVWLEEDCDVATWLHALAKRDGHQNDVQGMYTRMLDEGQINVSSVEQTYITDLPSYYPQGAKKIAGWE